MNDPLVLAARVGLFPQRVFLGAIKIPNSRTRNAVSEFSWAESLIGTLYILQKSYKYRERGPLILRTYSFINN